MLGRIFGKYVKESQAPKTCLMWLQSGSPIRGNANGDLAEVRSGRMEIRAVGLEAR